MSILIGIFTFVLILISGFLILVVLAQKAKTDGGMGAALGGGAAEAAFGADTGNVLSKATINASIAFFVLCFLLFLARIHQHNHGAGSGEALPVLTAPVSAPDAATPTPDAVAPGIELPAPAPANEPQGAETKNP